MRLALLVAPAFLLAACDGRPKTAEWRNVCVQTETRFSHMNLMVINGTTHMSPVYVSDCVARERRCIAGKDGSTVCPAGNR